MNDTPHPSAPTGGFSLVRGGPTYRAFRRLGLVDHSAADAWRLPLFAFVVAFVPFIAVTLLETVVHGRPPRIAYEISVHARLALAIPAFCLAEPVVDFFSRRASARLLAPEVIAEGDAALRRLVAWAGRLRDSKSVELALVIVALASAQLVLSGLGPFRESTQTMMATSESSVAKLWYAVIGLPAFLFLALRWLWRWAIWAALLARVTRLGMKPEPLHPDRAGGLLLVSEASASFAPVVFGLSCVASSSWGSRMLWLDVPLSTFKPDLAVLVAVVLFVTFAPLLVFAPHLTRARLQARQELHRLSLQLTHAFRTHLIRPSPAPDLLDTGAFEGLDSLHEIAARVDRMRALPVSRRAILVVVSATLLPVLPLLLSTFSLMDLADRLGHALLGGMH